MYANPETRTIRTLRDDTKSEYHRTDRYEDNRRIYALAH